MSDTGPAKRQKKGSKAMRRTNASEPKTANSAAALRRSIKGFAGQSGPSCWAMDACPHMI